MLDDVDPAQLRCLAPRLRLLDLEATHEKRKARALAEVLASFEALEDAKLELSSDCFKALSQRSLAAWDRVRSLDIPAEHSEIGAEDFVALLSRIASDMTGLRELATGAELSLPLPPDITAALRGRLRRLRAYVVDSHASAAMQDEQRRQLAELQDALGAGVKVEPYWADRDTQL
eukprot:tig00020604_g11863.t1